MKSKIQVVAKRWRIDLQSRQEAHLLLSAVSLPGGVQRRRTQEDELNMRSVFKEGSLISVRRVVKTNFGVGVFSFRNLFSTSFPSRKFPLFHLKSSFFPSFLLSQAEVQAIHHDGTVMLHTRSSKYGLLTQGRVVRVPAELVRRQRHHFQQLENVGVDIILGCNGLVWVTHHVEEGQEQQQQGQQGEQPRNDKNADDDLKRERPEPNAQQRQAVVRVSQSVIALARLGLVLQANTIFRVVQLSLERNIEPKSIVEAEFLSEIAADEEKLRKAGGEAEMAT